MKMHLTKITKKIALLGLVLAPSLSFVANVNAEYSLTDDTTFQVSITDFLTLTVDQSDNVAQLNALTRFNTGSVVASVATNNAAGYTLTFEDADDRNGLERAGYETASTEDKPLYNIPSVAAATEYADLADDTYGYFLGSTTATEATYLPVPLSSTEIASSDEPTALAESTTVNFGVKIAATRPSGTYQDTVVISAVANMGNISFDDAYSAASKSRDNTSGKYKLHEMTPSICEAVTTDQTGELVDIRDGTVYHVGKLKDNRCWLLDNLALDPTQSTVKANMTDINTNASAAAITNYKEGGNISGYAGWATEAVSVETNTSIHNQPRVNAASKNVIPSDGLSTDGGWKVGIYYNYCAASIGTYCYDDESGVDTNTASAIDAEYDICPANWRMPTGGSNDDQSGYYTGLDGGEYQTLYDKYDDLVTFRTFFHLPLSGSFTGGSSGYQGSSVDIWSSTFKYSYAFYDLYAGASGSVSPQDGDTRDSGFSVRCIAKTGTEPAPNPTPVDPDPNTTTFDEAYAAAGKTKATVGGNQYYTMQDMSPSICEAITEIPSELQVVDIRDNTIYWIGKLADNRCWLLDNLALDLTAKGASTNITTSNTNADADSLTSLFYGNRANGGNYATAGVSSWTSSYSYSAPLINASNKDVLPTTYSGTDEPLASTVTSENWKVGIYYNYCAASAGSYCYGNGTSYNTSDSIPVDKAGTAIDSEYDICPSSWRMPTGYNYDAADRPDGGEYKSLYDSYPSINGGDSQYVRARKALRLPLSGYIEEGVVGYQGAYGTFLASTFDGGGPYIFSLFAFTSEALEPVNNHMRNIGSSIRCIAKTGNEPAPLSN